jgi:hypothetical protein
MIGFELAVQWFVFAVMAAVMAARGQLTIFHPTTVYLAFHAVVFCIRPSLIYFFGFDKIWHYIGFFPTDAEMARALYLSSAGLVVFCVAFLLTSPHPGPKTIEGRREFTREERQSFFVMVLLIAPLGAYSVFASDMQGERIGGVFIMTGTSGYLNELQQVLIPITVLLIVMCRWKWYSFIPLILFLFHRASEGWGRWTIILTFFALVLYHAWEKRRNFPSLKFIIPLPLIAVLFANLGVDRAYFRNLIEGNREEVREVMERQTTFKERFDTLDFANFDYLTYIVAVVPERTNTFTFGSQYLQIFTEPIPRHLWQNKPVGPPVVFFDLNDYGNFIGLTPSLVGDGWMSGGWIGALLTMALAGWLLGLFYNWFVKHQANIFYCFLFIMVNAVLVQLFRDGGISITKFLLFNLLPIFVWMFLSRYVFPNSRQSLEQFEQDDYEGDEEEDEELEEWPDEAESPPVAR